jgi:hypothetical protein
MTTTADLYQDIMGVEDAANRLAAVAAQSLADARALAERVKAMPLLATDLRIAPAEFLDCPIKFAPVARIEEHAAGGGLVLVKVKVKKLLQTSIFWAYVVKANEILDTVEVVRLDPVDVHIEEFETVQKAKTTILAVWFWSKYGA